MENLLTKGSVMMCSVESCDRPVWAKGLCNSHLWRLRKHGNVQADKPLRAVLATLEERFWSKVIKTDTCWLWTGAHNGDGYGRFDDNGRQVPAHKWAYESVHGPIPVGTMIDHINCYTPACVRPDHLRPATRKQNGENRPGVPVNNTSGVRGVSFQKQTGKWVVSVTHHGKRFHGGSFATKDEAAAAVTKLRNKLHTHNEQDRLP